jgi:hypothetical protein
MADNKISLTIPNGAKGSQLRDLQFKFINILPMATERMNVISLRVSTRKTRIANMEAEALLVLKNDEDVTTAKSQIQGKILNAKVRLFIKPVPFQEELDKNAINITSICDIKNIMTSIAQEEQELNNDLYELATIKSKAEQIEHLLWAIRTALSWDKEEFSHTGG